MKLNFLSMCLALSLVISNCFGQIAFGCTMQSPPRASIKDDCWLVMPNVFFTLLMRDGPWGEYFDQSGFDAGYIIDFSQNIPNYPSNRGTPLEDNVFTLPPLPALLPVPEAPDLPDETMPDETMPDDSRPDSQPIAPLPIIIPPPPPIPLVTIPKVPIPQVPIPLGPITNAPIDQEHIDTEIVYIHLTQFPFSSDFSVNRKSRIEPMPLGFVPGSGSGDLGLDFHAAWQLSEVTLSGIIDTKVLLNIACLCDGEAINLSGDGALKVDLTNNLGSLRFMDFGGGTDHQISGALTFISRSNRGMIIDNSARLELEFNGANHVSNARSLLSLGDSNDGDHRGIFYTKTYNPAINLIGHFGSPCADIGCGAEN